MTPARKPRTECCCQPVAAMMAAIVVPARSRSIATTCAFLVPARVLGAPEAVPTGTGRFDDLRLIVFGRARVMAFGLDLVLVMGASGGLRDAIRRTTSAPPRQVTRRGPAQKRASAASIHHSNARFAEECQSILSNMIALCLPAILTPYGAPLRISRTGVYIGAAVADRTSSSGADPRLHGTSAQFFRESYRA